MGPQPRIPAYTDLSTPWYPASPDPAKAGDSHATCGPTKLWCVPGPEDSGSVKWNPISSTPAVGTCRSRPPFQTQFS